MVARLQGSAIPSLRLSAILVGFTVPISVALDNLLLVIVLLAALPNARAVWKIAVHHPVARAAWLLFGMLLIGVSYGMTPLGDAVSVLAKYIDLALIPAFMFLLATPTHRLLAQNAFLAAMGLTLLLSYLVGLQLIGVQPWMSNICGVSNPVVFHSYITQNNMMAFAAFLALLKCRDAFTTKPRLAWAAFAGFAVVNVLFMVQGRTGYIILLVLLCWFAWTTLARYFHKWGKVWGWKQGAIVLMASMILVFSAFSASPRMHDRVSLVADEFHAWHPNQENQSSSTGTRLNFYYNAAQIIVKHPLMGVGTGGFKAAFTEQIKGTNLLTTSNPHNEFLLVTAQLGLLGLTLMLYLFFTLWRNARNLDTTYTQDAARGLVLAYLVNCAFNSALHDHADGLFFAFMTAVLFANLKVAKYG